MGLAGLVLDGIEQDDEHTGIERYRANQSMAASAT
jgi:hypothetical protein